MRGVVPYSRRNDGLKWGKSDLISSSCDVLGVKQEIIIKYAWGGVG